MKIGYYLIKPPFIYHVSYLNGNLDYTPPNHKLVNLFGTFARAASKSTSEIILSVPINDGGAGGFDYTLEVANVFDNIIINNNLYNFSVEQLCSTYQNHVVCKADYHIFWTQATEETQDIKSDDGTYKPEAFHKFCNTFFNNVASAERPVVAGNCLLHYMHSGKKKPQSMSPQTFYTGFQKAMHAAKQLDCCYFLDLDKDETKILIIYSFPKEHIQDCVYHGNCDFNSETLKDLKIFPRSL